jgi:hypothetical protein
VIAFYFEGATLQDISTRHAVPTSTVKSRLMEARRRMRKEWKMNHNTDSANDTTNERALLLELYATYSAAFSRRSADGILALYAPEFQIHWLRYETKDAAWLEHQVRWEVNADFPQPRGMRFDIEAVEKVQAQAPRQIRARVRCQRFGKEVNKEGAAVRWDTWEERAGAPHGWLLVETRSLVV